MDLHGAVHGPKLTEQEVRVEFEVVGWLRPVLDRRVSLDGSLRGVVEESEALAGRKVLGRQ